MTQDRIKHNAIRRIRIFITGIVVALVAGLMISQGFSIADKLEWSGFAMCLAFISTAAWGAAFGIAVFNMRHHKGLYK